MSFFQKIGWCFVLTLFSPAIRAQDTLLLSTVKKDITLLETGKAYSLYSLSTDPAEVLAASSWSPLHRAAGKTSDGYHWLRFFIKNDLPDPVFTDFIAPGADSVLLYSIRDPAPVFEQLTGYYTKPRQWPFREYPDLFFIHSLPGETQELLIRFSEVRRGVFTAERLYMRPRDITLNEAVENYRVNIPRIEFNGFFLGVVTVMMLFSFFLYFRAKEKSLLFYSFYLFGAACYSLVVKSLPYSYLSRLAYLDFELTYQLGEPVQYFFFAAYAWFSKHLLDIDERYGLLYRFVRYLAIALLVAGLLLLAANVTNFNYHFQRSIFIWIRLLLLPIALILVIWIARVVKSPVKWFFIAGSTFFIVGGVVAFLMDPKSRHLFFDATYISPVVAFKSGILLESLCFSLAVSFKLRLITTEKEKATHAYIRQVELNRQLIATEKERLEKMVRERTEEIIEKNTLLEKQRQQQLKTDFEKQLAETEMQALRSQMNPHFIFNSLNSIRHQILTSNYSNAADYLMRFAKLLRHILQNSREHVVPLAEEINLIRLYLQLEKLRFGDRFEYHLSINPGLETDTILIPSMMLQPYVENALKHGISSSQRLPRKIDIRIFETEEGFRYEIEDNGIGREAAALKKTDGEKSGLGTKITAERIALFNATYNQKIDVIFRDLKNGKGEPEGTKVIITQRISHYSLLSI